MFEIVRGNCPLALAILAAEEIPRGGAHNNWFQETRQSVVLYGMRFLACFPAYVACVMPCLLFGVVLTVFCFSAFGSVRFILCILFVCGPVRFWLQHVLRMYVPVALGRWFHLSLSSFLRCTLGYYCIWCDRTRYCFPLSCNPPLQSYGSVSCDRGLRLVARGYITTRLWSMVYRIHKS